MTFTSPGVLHIFRQQLALYLRDKRHEKSRGEKGELEEPNGGSDRQKTEMCHDVPRFWLKKKKHHVMSSHVVCFFELKNHVSTPKVVPEKMCWGNIVDEVENMSQQAGGFRPAQNS